MGFLGPTVSISSSTGGSESIQQAISSNQGLITACFAPTAIYVLIYGEGIHFAYLFAFILLTRILINIDMVSMLKPTVVAPLVRPPLRTPMAANRPSFSRPHLHATPSVQGPKASPSTRQSPSSFLNSPSTVAVPTPTAIQSQDCTLTKTRRGIINKISPDKLDELVVKLVDTFNLHENKKVLARETSELLTLIFAAASRQAQYIGVFAELIARVSAQVLDPVDAEEILTNQCQHHWSTICISPVERTKGWEQLCEDEQADLRARHRAKQLATAEFCGLLASNGLVPPAFPLLWLETLMKPISAVATSKNSFQSSSTEAVLEIICCAVRGLGPSEAQGLFTEIDQERFSDLCRSLFRFSETSCRIKCIIQDLRDLRESEWSKLPTWKQALLPTKRTSSI